MVKKENGLTTERVENACRGDGYVNVTTLLAPQEAKGKLRSLSIYSREENCALGKHFHVGEAVLLYCISGRGWIDDNGEKKEFEAGDAAFFPSGEFYSLRNAAYHDYAQNGRDPLVVLAAVVMDEHTKREDAPAIVGFCSR
jgi:quercetin dioxygenase-like cupin family protein